MRPTRRRLAAFTTLLLVLALACAGMGVSYDYTELEERNLFRGESD